MSAQQLRQDRAQTAKVAAVVSFYMCAALVVRSAHLLRRSSCSDQVMSPTQMVFVYVS